MWSKPLPLHAFPYDKNDDQDWKSPPHVLSHPFFLPKQKFPSPSCPPTCLYTQWLTCGGGRPPAPSGHTGSIFLILSLLHWQVGEGFSIVQFPFWNRSVMVCGTGAVVHSSSPTKQGMSLQREDSKGRITWEGLAFPVTLGVQISNINCKQASVPSAFCYLMPHRLVRCKLTLQRRTMECKMGLNAHIQNSIQLSPPALGHSPMSSLNKYSLSICVYILGWPGQSPCRHRVYVPTESWTTNNIIFDTPQWSKTKGEWQVGKIRPKRWYFSQNVKNEREQPGSDLGWKNVMSRREGPELCLRNRGKALRLDCWRAASKTGRQAPRDTGLWRDLHFPLNVLKTCGERQDSLYVSKWEENCGSRG